MVHTFEKGAFKVNEDTIVRLVNSTFNYTAHEITALNYKRTTIKYLSNVAIMFNLK